MSRVGKNPVELPKGVEVTAAASSVKVKGPKGELTMALNPQVQVNVADGKARVGTVSTAPTARVVSGTTRALLANMVTGVTKGFERKLELVGVGYRAQAQGRKLNLTLGFSHPVAYPVPEGITVETPSQTEIVIKGIDRQKVGQVAAEIRRYRAPEPYKGKGVRFAGEKVVLKEAKKK
ncbi:50S ribosomal protein L6 [Gammaproteobacteria bacterium]|nr:50S ribosomal protein L6 [Gammaproteobacteria bacterium]QOJ30649.1 MAG: 50S ribosomal protein L6 [Gammaproteobacteria bacterium]CAG0941062.1 50S ribosomal protein L6 [Gammaproteobacteria bacterium]